MARVFALMLVLFTADASVLEQKANPIRKVVTMLQNMQKQVTAEGEKEQELFDKFMCYCKTGRGDLEASIADANNKISNMGAAVLELSAKKVQTEADLKAHQGDRADAKDAMAKAASLREQEAAAFAKEESDAKTNIAALAKATVAIEKGATGFLQTSAAKLLKTLAIEKADISDAARQELLSFLSGTQDQGYVPQSGEIVGILKQMHDEMSAGLAEATAAEESAIQTYEALMAAKKKEVATLSAQIETELKRVGDLGVELAGTANDLEDTKDALAEDSKFLAELNTGCDKKAAQWEEIKATRAEELVALAETIKVLNDDDALELFKKTLPGASSSLIQVDSSAMKALNILRAVRKEKHGPARQDFDFIEMALKGKHVGFEKVVKMIDEMIANLKVEQTDDDNKRDYCNSELDKTDDKKKGLQQSIADSETAIAELEGAMATLRDEISALQAGVKALDKSVADATAQRKAEHAEYNELMANDGAAKDVLKWAKNRLNKFYNPKLYVAPPKRQLSEEDRIVVNMGGTLAATQPPAGIAGTGISALQRGAPAPPPATFGPYQKKSGEGNGVVAMIDLLVKDLDKEMTEAKTSETDAQADYESLMAESAAKRAQDSKSITDKGASLASAEESLQAEQDAKAGTTKELAQTVETIHALHGECDWLLQYFEARKAARAGEVDALGNAKAVLNGADYSLVQVERHEMTPRESRKMMANAKAFSEAAKTHFNKKEAKVSKLEAKNASTSTQFSDMNVTAKTFMEVSLGPFSSAPEACDYCADSFTKTGQPPAGPVAPACVCMAYPSDGGFTMFCATPPSAAGFVKEKGGCRCNPRDMEHMAATTCEPL